MHRIDHSTAVASLPAPGAPGTPGFFTEGDPIGGVSATVVTQAWANALQEELIAVVEAASLTPDKANNAQLLAAIQAIIAAAIPAAPGDASETVKGVLKLATTALAQSLDDDGTAVTPKKAGQILDVFLLGRGQTWQDVTASRAYNTNYTNTTGRTIEICVFGSAAAAIPYLQINGKNVVGFTTISSATIGSSITALIPDGATYRITGGAFTVTLWSELR